MNLQLVQFKRNPDTNSIHLKFNDGYETDVSLELLRNYCPCASCRGEEVLFHKYEPLNKAPITQSGYRLEKAVPVGKYAIQLFWEDGHDTGIYTWEYLREISQKS